MEELTKEIRSALVDIMEVLAQIIGAIDEGSSNQLTEADKATSEGEPGGFFPTTFVPSREVSQFLSNKEE